MNFETDSSNQLIPPSSWIVPWTNMKPAKLRIRGHHTVRQRQGHALQHIVVNLLKLEPFAQLVRFLFHKD